MMKGPAVALFALFVNAPALAGTLPLMGAGKSRCAAWTPANLSTAPLFWVDTDSGVSTSGSNVTAWTNKGSAANFSAATGSPQLTASVFPAGQSGVTFGTSAQYLTAASGFSGVNPFYSFAIIKRNTANSGTVGGLFGSQWIVGSSGSSGVVFYAMGNVTSGALVPGNVFGFNAGNSTVVVNAAVNSTDTSSPHMMSTLMGSTITPEIRYDGSIITLTTSNARTTTSSVMSLNLGTGGPTNESLQGSVGAFFILGYSPTTGDKEKMEGWAAWKYWGSGNPLPSGHTYKSAAPCQ